MNENKSIVDVKQRILGAVVIISLAIIFLPMILSNHSAKPSASQKVNLPQIPDELKNSASLANRSIPNFPAMPEIAEPEVFPIDELNIESFNSDKKAEPIIEQASNAAVKSSVEKKKNVKPVQTPSTIRKKPVVEKNKSKIIVAEKQFKKENKSPYKNNYTIQLGSFSQLSNAQTLTYKLRKKKFKSYLEMIKISGKKHYRVRVGPFILLKQAEKTKLKIKQMFRINGRVISNDL